MAEPFQRENGKWAFTVELPPDGTGRRRQKWYSGYKTKTEARRKQVLILAEIEKGTFIEPSAYTVETFFEKWLEGTIKERRRAATYEGYRSVYNTHIRPVLGKVKLSRLTPLHVQDFLSACYQRGTLSDRSVRHAFHILKIGLRQAVRWELLARNPADLVEAPKCEKTESRHIRPDDLARLFVAIRGDWVELPVLLAVFVGLRRGETLGLQWKDIDLDAGVVSVERQLLKVEKGTSAPVYGPPKSTDGKRSLKVPPRLVAELRRRKGEQAKLRLRLGDRWHDHDLVACWQDGRPHTPDGLTYRVTQFCKRLGIDGSFHSLRHSNGTLQFLVGVPANVVSKRLGHSSVAITNALYIHVLEEMDESAAAALGTALDRVLGAG